MSQLIALKRHCGPGPGQKLVGLDGCVRLTKPYPWGMDTEQMMADLIAGNLIKILDAGTGSDSVAFTVRDDHSETGFGIVYRPFEEENTSPHGKQVTPQNATDRTGVIGGRKHEVRDYLVESFGLTALQARHVVDEAHALPLSS